MRLHFILSHQNAQRTFEDIPRFIVSMVNMQRRDKPGRSGGAAVVASLDDNKLIVDGTKNVSGKRWSDHRGLPSAADPEYKIDNTLRQCNCSYLRHPPLFR
jgi:hypothetical protein